MVGLNLLEFDHSSSPIAETFCSSLLTLLVSRESALIQLRNILVPTGGLGYLRNLPEPVRNIPRLSIDSALKPGRKKPSFIVTAVGWA